MGVSHLDISTVLTHGDLLESEAGQKHQGAFLNIARRVWPRWFFKRFAKENGLFMLIHGTRYSVDDPNSVIGV